ncbi:Scaffold-type E3 ligase [Tulasnella sp. 419]|nr:Scaffold-type E3 ligase [Tulasnella sp. 418]KAG8962002.1 Scaffold-type E3 ligase [Tulasnella sp. 419]
MATQAKKDAAIAQFRSITSAGQSDAIKWLRKTGYKVDEAIDNWYSDPSGSASAQSRDQQSGSMVQKLNTMFDEYKDASGEAIGIDGTIALCQDLGVDPEDVVLLALACDLKSPSMGQWPKKEWIEGLKTQRVDSIPAFKSYIERLRKELSSEHAYFRQVYNYTFTFALNPGQRSLGLEEALAFWGLLIPAGLHGGALKPLDQSIQGWSDEHTQWWFDFLKEKNVKGISKDTWNMFTDFVRSIDARFEKHDLEAAWPSLIDDFVEHAREKAATAA